MKIIGDQGITKMHKKNFAVSFGKLISKFIPSGIVLPILTGPLRGAKYIVGSAAGEAKGLSVIFNLSELKELGYIEKLLQTHSKGIIFDIGANVGLMTILFARYAEKVFCFEPFPQNISLLYRTLEVNHINNATIIPCAVSDSFEYSSFERGESCSSGKLKINGNQPAITVSIDGFAEAYKVFPNFIKIDVEGGEMSVLKGGERFFLKYKPIIILDIHGEELRVSCLDYLRQIGYQNIFPIDNVKIAKATKYAFSSEPLSL